MDAVERNSLYSLPLFSKLPEHVLDEALHLGKLKIKQYSAGQIVHVEGDHCTNVELIMSGRLSIERIDYSGALLAIAQFSREDILGGNLLYSGKPHYPWTITALEETTVAMLTGDSLFSFLCDYPDLLKYFLRMISENTQVLNEKIMAHINRSVRERITNYLILETERQQSNAFRLPMPKSRLAEILGMQRTSLSRELDRMRKEGMLVFNGRNFISLKLENKKDR